MPKIGRKLRIGIVGVCALIIGAYPVYAAAAVTTVNLTEADLPAVIITEFQTNGGSASQEFIELYNTTDEDISFGSDGAASAWKIQFFNSAAAKTGSPVWTTPLTASNSIELKGTIAANSYYLVASTDYVPGGIQPNMSYPAASSHLMTDTGGALQLLSADSVTGNLTAHDRVLWLAQASGVILPAGVLASPSITKSLQRIPNENELYLDESGTVSAFGPEDSITPLERWLPPASAEPEPDNPEDGQVAGGEVSPDPTSTEPTANEGLVAPAITELLPNPASPLTDADDEFIELFNPNAAAFDLEGYKLEVGSSTVRSYTFPAGSILPPLGYLAFHSADTGLSLSNSGSQVKLRDPAGLLLGETQAYTTAEDGEAWILVDGTWQWTTSATPALANILAVPAAPVKASKAATTKPRAAAAKKPTTKAAAKPKATKAKATKQKAAKKKKTETVKPAASVTPEKPKPPIHVGVLVAVVSVAVLYGLYEYRHDIALRFKQLGRNRKAGLGTGLASAGR